MTVAMPQVPLPSMTTSDAYDIPKPNWRNHSYDPAPLRLCVEEYNNVHVPEPMCIHVYRGSLFPFRLNDNHRIPISLPEYYVPIFLDPPYLAGTVHISTQTDSSPCHTWRTQPAVHLYNGS